MTELTPERIRDAAEVLNQVYIETGARLEKPIAESGQMPPLTRLLAYANKLEREHVEHPALLESPENSND